MRLQEIPVKKQSNNRWFLFHHAFSIGSSICGIAGESVNWWSPHGRRFPTWRKLHPNHPFWPAFCWIVCVCVCFFCCSKNSLSNYLDDPETLRLLSTKSVGFLLVTSKFTRLPPVDSCRITRSPHLHQLLQPFNPPWNQHFYTWNTGVGSDNVPFLLGFGLLAGAITVTLPIFPPPWSTCSPRAASNNMIQVLHTCWWQLGF